MIPGLAITGEMFSAFLYDCVNDLLLETHDPVVYRKGTDIVPEAIVVLWALLNHRTYLKAWCESSPKQDIVSSFHQIAQGSGHLSAFEKLERYNL